MKIQDKQFQKIVKQFDSFVPNGIKCPICGKNDWILGDSIAEISLGRDENGLVVFPVVLLSCKNCGNVQIFNAFKLGIAQSDEDLNDEQKNKETESKGISDEKQS